MRILTIFVLLAFTIASGPARSSPSDHFELARLTPEKTYAQNALAENFIQPPDSARPWVYWFFMDGNLSREGISVDLEAMKAAGIGGVIIMEVNAGIPRGPVEFMSEEWRALFKHAVEEAERLGLEITLNAGPGWTGSGGPWVKTEESMQHLVSSAVDVSGGTTFDAVLPLPEPRKPYFGEEGLPAELLQARERFYADVAVLAVPKTPEDARIPDIDEKALYLRHPYTSYPNVKPYLPAPATFPETPPEAAIPKRSVIDLTSRLQPDGRLAWDVPPGQWTILRFGRRNTGANTRPAPQPGLGFESDKFDPAALDAHFDFFIGSLLRTIGPRPNNRTSGWTMLHIDSWEMGAQNWTANFRREFQNRRGYDPTPYLPAMTGRIVDSVEISERFLWDLRFTAQELVIENHAQRLKELGRQYGFGLSIEPYDMNPTSDMVLGGVADVPMCEFWAQGYGFDSTFSCIESTSIAHTQGKPIVAAESFTSDSNEAWKLFPGAMKNQGDWALCTGINRFVFHRFAHQPWLDRQPGMTMGPYGVHWDRTQTWWPLIGDYHRYLARCQWLLRQGTPVADICYLIPEGAPHVFLPPKSALEGELPDRRGYNFDGCSPDVLVAHASVKNQRIVFSGGAEYRLLVLPAFETMTPDLLKAIQRLAESGAPIAGPAPRKSPSLSGYPQCDREIETLAKTLWGNFQNPIRDIKPGKDNELYPGYEDTARMLAGMGIPPDFEADGSIRYTHRRLDNLDFYFIANRKDEFVQTPCRFRVKGKTPQLWDPLTGEIRALPEYEQRGEVLEIPLQFEPHQSYFIVFPAEPLQTARETKSQRNFPTASPIAPIGGSWEVSFKPELGGPGKVRREELKDWSHYTEPEIRFYSGVAIYSTTFDLPPSHRGKNQRLALGLGKVHEMARVTLNGTDLGGLWCEPWRLDISKAVRDTDNRLEIEVANLWPNRLIGDGNVPQEKRISWAAWNPYKPTDPLLPSGLLGPVQIVEME